MVPICRHFHHILEGSRPAAFYTTERVSEQMSKTLTPLGVNKFMDLSFMLVLEVQLWMMYWSALFGSWDEELDSSWGPRQCARQDSCNDLYALHCDLSRTRRGKIKYTRLL